MTGRRRDPPPPDNVVSIAAELEARAWARLDERASRLRSKEGRVLGAQVKLARSFATFDFDEAIRECARSDDPEAAAAVRDLRCARALKLASGGDEARGLAEWEALAREHPSYALVHLVRGRWWAESKSDPRRALPDLDQAASLAPERPAAYWARALAYQALGDHDRALANYRRAAALEPDEPQGLYEMAKCLAAHGDAREALPVWERLVALDPGDADYRAGRDAAAVAVLSGVVGGLPGLAPDEQDAALAEAVGRFPEVAELAAMQATLLGAHGKHEQALAAWDRAMAAGAEPRAEHHASRAGSYIVLQRFEDALADCARAIELDPGHARARAMRGICRRRLSEGQESGLEDLDRAVELAPADAEIRYWRASILRDDERYAEAMVDYDRAIESRPGWALLYEERGFTRGELDEGQGWIEASLADYDEAFALGRRTAELYTHKASALQARFDWAAALAVYDEGVKELPDEGRILSMRASLRSYLGDAAGAAADRAAAAKLGWTYAP